MQNSTNFQFRIAARKSTIRRPMMLSLTMTTPPGMPSVPATDLGYLLAKNPARHHEVELPFGIAHVFYPEASNERCTAVLYVELDPVGLARQYRNVGSGDSSLAQYVNDRPFAASSFLSVAISMTLKSALNGNCRDRPELVEVALPLTVELPCVPCRGGIQLVEELFAPLGLAVRGEPVGLDQMFPEWGQGPYWRVTLSGSMRVSALLSALYLLIPVLDDDKHYWVGRDELEKLLAKGGDWLRVHPKRELIVTRYLKRQRGLIDRALTRLDEGMEDNEDVSEESPAASVREETLERSVSLRDRRIEAILAEVDRLGATSVADLGCGEGRLLRALLARKSIARIVGVDPSIATLESASKRLKLERMKPRLRERISLLHGSLTYRDKRIAGFDVAVLAEVIEHIDATRLGALERSLFEFARPRTVLVTTPNREYNALFPTLAAGKMRHHDHRFEWTRGEFEDWARGVASRQGYTVTFSGIGDHHDEHGCPTQMATFSLA